MKLHEIYEGVQFISIMELAERIVSLKSKRKFRELITDEEWRWLQLTCEDQSVLRKLSAASSKYTSFNRNWKSVDSEMLRSGGTCAEAFSYLTDIKKEMDEHAKTRVLQATDEVMNSEEMAQIAKQQALLDLQNSANNEQSDSAELVSSLADKAVDI